MALSQALSTGITGLMSHQKAMDNIGNNLANVNTVGFKKGVYQFTTLLEQAMRGGMMADSNTGRGSINPISMGLGTQTGSINKVFTQGALENTGNPYDMAIEGNGFFVLRQENGYVYTRAGSFYKGEDGTLMAGNGLYVQGTMAVKSADGSISIPQDAKLQNIVIPIGAVGGHSQTTEVGFTGNLDSRQTVSTGTRLFGSSSFPTVSNLQQWMWKDFNGGVSDSKNSVDKTWDSLETKTFAMSRATSANYAASLAGVTLPSSVNVYSDGMVMDFATPQAASRNACVYYVLDVSDPTDPRVRSVSDITNGASEIMSVQGLQNLSGLFVPLVEEVKVINGGNVQTSAAYAVEVPAYVSQSTKHVADDGKTYEVNNKFTYPKWFYESTGGNYTAARMLSDAAYDVANSAVVAQYIWPNGVNGGGWPNGVNMPYPGETYAASLQTPLEHLRYLKGNVWVQPFAGIGNGKDIDISFKKGDSQVTATFTYNRPVGPDPFNGQQAIDREQSYTLEHLLKFLAGDVNDPSIACQRITPAMFGAPITPEYPDGNYNDPDWDRDGYEEALKNIQLATDEGNLDSVGGAMGLLSIPPQVSDKNYGDSAYDSPVESAGAYTRTGLSNDIYYDVWNPSTGLMEKRKGSSFNTSFVSNLGSMNALSDIRISYNNVPHDTMYKTESEYSAPQGGSATVSVDFYDSLGNPKQATVRMAMVEQSDDFTTWRWYADCVDDTDFPWQADPSTGEITSNLNIGTGLIRFDKNGNFVNGSDYSESSGITINLGKQGVNEPIVLGILNGLSAGSKQALDFSDLTCSATSNSFKLAKQNGRPPGTLNDFTVGLDGVIQGIYSNGNVVEIARLGLATIPNENGLIAAGNNLFYAGPASGDPLYGHANTGGSGEIRHLQLESSNVDLSEEFTKLISTERGFQANSRTITTADEMITELLNLKR